MNEPPAPPPRSLLYVPADQPRMLARAFERQADAIIVDLEDAVPVAAKPAARRALARWLDGLAGTGPARSARPEVWVRISAPAPGDDGQAADLATAVRPGVHGVVQAKCASVAVLRDLDGALAAAEQQAGCAPGSVRVAPVIETPGALLDVREIAAGPRVTRLHLGEADLIAALGLRPGPDRAELLPLRLAVVTAAAAAGLAGVAGPADLAIADPAAVRESSQALRRLGFTGRTAIHPAQVPVINEVFGPTSEEEAVARELLSQFAAAAGGVIVDAAGRMADEAVLRSARAVVARAEQIRGKPERDSGHDG